MRLTGKVAVVTGGNTGIGRAISLALAQEGAGVAIAYVTRSLEAQELVTAINRETAGSARAYQADVTQEEDIKRLFSAVVADFVRLDILVNNAGINIPATLLELSAEDWDRVLDTNLRGPFLCSREAVRWMVDHGGGAIVNISSESGMSLITCPGTNPHYAAAKMGLIGLTRVMAVNLAPGIRVNAVAPGWIDTELHNVPEEQSRAATVLSQIPLKRAGEPSEVAQLVVFLASDEASYITGQTIAIGGGRVLH